MNSDEKNTASKFEQLSPVLELMYLMVTNMQKYLKVYAEDMQLQDLSEFKDVHESLLDLKKKMDAIYGIADSTSGNSRATAKPESPKQSMQPKAEQKNPFDDMRQSLNDLRNSIDSVDEEETVAAPAPQSMPQSPMQQPPTFMPPQPQQAPVPMMNPMNQPPQTEAPMTPVAPVASPQMPASPEQMQQPQHPAMQSQSNEIDSILAELRKLQSNSKNN
jgi:hypothetical protein